MKSFQNRSFFLLLLSLGALFMFFVPTVEGGYDWDWMNCHNHGWYRGHNYTGDDMCICNKSWGGVDCTVCSSDSSCPGKEQKCAKQMQINQNNYYNCRAKDPTKVFGINGTIVAEFHFPNCTKGEGSINVFDKPTGAPLDFNCTLTECTKNFDDPNFAAITCQNIKCQCTTWCGLFVKAVIDNAVKGLTTFSCNKDSGDCIVKNLPMLDVELQCEASTCEIPFTCGTPPVPFELPFIWKVVIALGAVFGTFAVIAAIIILCIFYQKKRAIIRKQLWNSLDHTNAPATITFRDVSCFIKIGLRGAAKQVLFNVSGTARPGQITAIMGPSGGGKTTLIDILAARKTIGVVQGEVLVNGEKKKKNFKRISGYVLQDDVMMGTLTVREQVTYAAMLRLPSLMPHDEKIGRVNHVLEELGISHIANSQIGTDMTRGISGGERKRVSIATELVTNPSILFLDEPTSGLDAYNASSLMQTLKRLALEHSTTIVLSIHQPRSDIFHQFDNLLVLSQGRSVYSGSPLEIIPYFSQLGYNCPQNFNPADFIIDTITTHPYIGYEDDLNIASGSRGKSRNYHWPKDNSGTNGDGNLVNIQSPGSDDGDDEEFPKYYTDDRSKKYLKKEYASSFATQFYILCRRTLVNIVRDPYLLRAQYILTVALSILLGFMFKDLSYDLYGIQGRAGCLFFLLCLLSFSSMSSLDTFFHERALFVREKAQGAYRTSAYFLAKTLCDIVPMRVVPPIILGTVTYWMVTHPQSDPEWAHYLWSVLVLILVSVVACAMSFAISCSCPSIGVSNLVAILVLLFFMLFGGLLANKTTIPEYLIWFKWLSFVNYGYEILMVNELAGTTVLFNPPGFPAVTVPGEEFLIQFDMSVNRWGLDIGVLLGMLCGYLSLSYLFLRFFIKERR